MIESRFDLTEYAKMRYKVKGEDLGGIIHRFSDMAVFKEVFYATNLPEAIDPDELFAYFCYMYDTGSPLRNILDLNKRKAQALLELNIAAPYPEAWMKALRWGLPAVNRRATMFLLVVGGTTYAMWQSTLEELNRLMETTVELDADSEKGKQDAINAVKTKYATMDVMREQIEKYKNDFLQGEASRELDSELMNFSLRSSLGIRPEEWIKNYEDGQPLFES
jgi:hypothetical protein